jgi:hypothetical protein
MAVTALTLSVAAAVAGKVVQAPSLKTKLQNLNFAAQRVAGRAVDNLATRAGVPTGASYPVARSTGDHMVESLQAAGFPTTGRSDHELWQEVREQQPGVGELGQA